MTPELRKAIDDAVENALNGPGDLTQEESEELEQYILEYERNTETDRQSVEDFEEYLDSFWRNR